MGCAESHIAPVSEEDFRAHLDSLRARYGMPHLSIAKRTSGGGKFGMGIFLAGGEAKAVAADLLSIVQKTFPHMELVEDDSNEFEVVLRPTKDHETFQKKLWVQSRFQDMPFCDNASLAVLDMMETHGYTLLNMLSNHEGGQGRIEYTAAIFKKA
jgi:hypothetical protein